jgi:hypothetical protein
MSSGARIPDGVTLSPFSSRVFNVLAEQTAFPWAVLQAQSQRCHLDPAALTPDGLVTLLPLLVSGVARFTSPEKGQLVRTRLELLLPRRR